LVWPRLTAVVPFATRQPTGMLLVGDALFVAGDRDIMVFDMRAAAPSGAPPLLATCGAACAEVASSEGQNFHSMAHRAEGGVHLLFVTAQIDNRVGCLAIQDPAVIALLE
jgi:hypothetical protein